MRDQLLFILTPWVAAVTSLVAAAIRYVQYRRGDQAIEPTTRSTTGLSPWWQYSIAVVLLGHVLAIAFPDALLLWNRQLVRLIALESVGVIAAGVALVSCIGLAIQQKWWTDQRDLPSPFDVIAATLIVLQLVSGIAIAVRYRWASSWSAVTLTPYLHSLVLKPSIVLVAHMPVVVKLHVFCAFALLGVMPLTRFARTFFAALRDLVRLTGAPVTVAWRPVWHGRRVEATRARRPFGDEEM
jgi:nitrate reductase gamma subunit